jgi:hypothetical protein
MTPKIMFSATDVTKAWSSICDKLAEFIVTRLLFVIDECRLNHNG